jgi:hypothetical protein
VQAREPHRILRPVGAYAQGVHVEPSLPFSRQIRKTARLTCSVASVSRHLRGLSARKWRPSTCPLNRRSESSWAISPQRCLSAQLAVEQLGGLMSAPSDRCLAVAGLRWPARRLGHRFHCRYAFGPRDTSLRRSGLDPVTNQVTTVPVIGRPSTTYSDTTIPLTCGDTIQCDATRRNRYAW